MRRRLIVTYVSLLAAVLVGLSVPLGIVLAGSDAQAMFIDRLDDTSRFASLAEPALRTGNTDVLDAELRQYDEMFGITAVIVNRDGSLFLTSGPAMNLQEPQVRRRIESALSGQQIGLDARFWPWQDDPLIVAAPIGSGGEIIGAALTVSPNDGLNATTRRSWTLLAVLSAVTLALGLFATIPLSRWMLRPVHELDEAARALAGGRFSSAVIVSSGPPELRQLTRTFTTMARGITALLERQRTFASYASHQLRTPLATLRLCVENLRVSVRDDGAEDYAMLAGEIERMAEMCDALLAYALAEVVEGEIQVQDAGAIVDSRIAVWRPSADRAGIRLVRGGEASAMVHVADQALDQTLDALLSNAIKFAGQGATVTVALYREGDQWVDVHVVDTGPGIPAEDLARATEPFWRGPSHQNVDGSGLGITIAQALVTACGGSLELGRAVPQGLHAHLRLRAGES